MSWSPRPRLADAVADGRATACEALREAAASAREGQCRCRVQARVGGLLDAEIMRALGPCPWATSLGQSSVISTSERGRGSTEQRQEAVCVRGETDEERTGAGLAQRLSTGPCASLRDMGHEAGRAPQRAAPSSRRSENTSVQPGV